MREFVKKNRTALLVGVVVVIALWAAFRPELLFVKKHVDDPVPGSTSYQMTSQKFIA